MDAVKFCEESRRMCSANKCAECPAVDGHFCKIALRYTNISSDAKVAIVEQWAKEHPVKTRQSEFLRQWPNAKMRGDGWLEVSPCSIDYKNYNAKACLSRGLKCFDCRREYWSQEVE